MKVRKDITVGPVGGTEILRRQSLFPDPFATTSWKGPKVGGKVRFVRHKGRLTPVRQADPNRAVGITGSGGGVGPGNA